MEIKIKIDISGWIKSRIRKLFLNRELKSGEILVLWRDWDKTVTGWKIDKEEHLIMISADMGRKKAQKMESITGIKGESS